MLCISASLVRAPEQKGASSRPSVNPRPALSCLGAAGGAPMTPAPDGLPLCVVHTGPRQPWRTVSAGYRAHVTAQKAS